ncbi:unnamed protein product [Heterobilharzia americana]|nr:unnamed protein product [Heterobilharzia americana]
MSINSSFWMPGYQPCSGGSNISCEYQTDKQSEEIEQLYQMNKCDIDKLIKAARDVSQSAACDVLNYNESTSSSSLPASESDGVSQNWARTVLQLQNAVSYLIHKSRLVHSELNSNNDNCDNVSSLTSSADRTPATSTAVNNQLNLVQSTGLQCFQQLCQNLSGHLLQCPLTKQVFANCVSELANEFLTNLSSQHQLILDMLVALPHLSNLLSTTFIPPNPSTLYINSKTDPICQHPLLPIYQRLMDIRFRCNAQTALNILEKINFKTWFSMEIKCYNKEQWNQLIHALFTCIQETTNITTTTNSITVATYSSEMNSRCSEENEDLHKLCIVHLKTLISNHYPDMFILAFQILLQNLSNNKCVDIWLLFQDLFISDIDTHSGFSSLSMEQLTQLLTQVHREMSSPITTAAGRSSVKSTKDTIASSSSICDSRSHVLLPNDKCCSMLQSNCPQSVQIIIRVLTILACQLCEKIGCCILNNHLSIQNGQSIIIDMLVQVFGLILQSSPTSSFSPSHILCLSPSSFALYAKCCLNAFSECLNSAIKACPTENNPTWSNQLINLFLIWFTSTTCMLNNFPYSVKSVQPSPISSSATATTTTNSTTTLNTNLNAYTQVHSKICLPLIIYSSINEEGGEDEKQSVQQNEDDESTFKWYLSFSAVNNIWRPNLDCLDAMIMMLMNCDHFVNSQFMKKLASSFIVSLLHNVQWWYDQDTLKNQSTEVPELRNWLMINLNPSYPLEKSMIRIDKAYVNSLTFLILLITSGLQVLSHKCTKIQLKTIMENILSSLDLL